jgi:membrane protein
MQTDLPERRRRVKPTSDQSTMTSLDRLPDRFRQFLWRQDLRAVPAWQRAIVQIARFVYAIRRDLTEGYLNLQAMSLVYTTLLSLVPLLAVSFSVLKGFGVHNQLEPLLLNALDPLGEKSVEVSNKIIEFVDNMRVGVLGSVGLAILLYTVISLIQKIEGAFNYTWHVSQSRTLTNRFGRYMSVLMIGPVLFFTAVGLTASVRSSTYVQTMMAMEPMGTLIELIGQLIPYLMLAAAFAFVYVFVPNTRVRLGSAFIGALVAAALWQTVGWGFATFMAGSTRYMAIYSGLAIVILFMIWVYIAWLILLIGASIAFYHQHPEYLARPTRELRLSNRLRERLALLAAEHIMRNHFAGKEPWSKDALARDLTLPSSNVGGILDALVAGGFLLRTDDEPARYVPARAPEHMAIKSMLDCVRCFPDGDRGCPDPAPDLGTAEIEERIDRAFGTALKGLTLKDLAGDAVAGSGDDAIPPGRATQV